MQGDVTPPGRTLISVFTAAHDSGEAVDRAYLSLVRQTHPQWEWVVVDDSEGDETSERIALLAQLPVSAGRVRLYRRYGSSGSIGATKAAAASLSRGDVLVELDHDDELLPEALDILSATFCAHPEADFVYSDWVDVADGQAIVAYGPGWGLGHGAYATEIIDGKRVPVALAPPITRTTLGHIVSVPNHVRAWRRQFYRHIGGHEPQLEVADDYDLLLRTFLGGTMARVPRPLYVQHHSSDRQSASRKRNADIQRLVAQQAAAYEDAVEQRCTALGLPSAPAASSPWIGPEPIRAANATVDVVAEAAARIGLPLVSVVIATYERPALLERAILSALSQTYKNVEVLVVGDRCGSLDGVVARVGDPRVRHWNLPARADDRGVAARNYSLKAMARGALIAYLDDDGAWPPDHLQAQVSALAADPAVMFTFSASSGLVHRRHLLEQFGYWQPSESDGRTAEQQLVARWADATRPGARPQRLGR